MMAGVVRKNRSKNRRMLRRTQRSHQRDPHTDRFSLVVKKKTRTCECAGLQWIIFSQSVMSSCWLVADLLSCVSTAHDLRWVILRHFIFMKEPASLLDPAASCCCLFRPKNPLTQIQWHWSPSGTLCKHTAPSFPLFNLPCICSAHLLHNHTGTAAVPSQYKTHAVWLCVQSG